MTEQDIRRAMVSLGASLFQRGFSVGGAGNLSARLPDGTLLASPTNACLGRLHEEGLAKISISGEQISGERMSKEVPFHLALYRNRPDCQAVVHLHSTYLTALSCCEGLDPENVIRPFTPYVVMRVGRLPLVPYFKPGSPKIAEELVRRCHDDVKAFLLANHGPVVMGSSLVDAVNTIEELEETARLLFILGDRKIRYLGDPEIAELRS